MGNAKYWVLLALKSLGRFSKKFEGLITSGTPPHTQVLGSIGSKGVCLRMREIVTLRRLFLPRDAMPYMLRQFRRLSGHHTGGSVKNG